MLNVLLIIIIGGIAVYQDLRYKKVKNWLISSGFAAGLCLLISLLIQRPEGISSALVTTIGMFLLSFSLALTAWYLKFWAAGDAKLFILFSFLLVFSNNNFAHLGFIFLTNIILITVCYLVLEMSLFMLFDLFRVLVVKKDFGKIAAIFNRFLKGVFNNKVAILKLIIGYFFIYILFRVATVYFINKVVLQSRFMGLFFILLFMLFRKFNNFLMSSKIRSKVYLITLGVYLLLDALFWKVVFRIDFLLSFFHFLYFVLAMSVFRLLYDWHIRKRGIVQIDYTSLKAGMILTEETLEKVKIGDNIGKVYPDGLTLDQVEKIREISQKDSLKPEVYMTIPFTPVIFAASIVTLLLNGHLLTAMLSLFKGK